MKSFIFLALTFSSLFSLASEVVCIGENETIRVAVIANDSTNTLSVRQLDKTSPTRRVLGVSNIANVKKEISVTTFEFGQSAIVKLTINNFSHKAKLEIPTKNIDLDTDCL